MTCRRCNGTRRVPMVIIHTYEGGYCGEEPGVKDCPACTSVTGEDEPEPLFHHPAA